MVDTSPTLNPSFRQVQGSNRTIYANAQFTSKQIQVTGSLYAGSLFDFEELKDRLNGLIVDSKPYFITKMLPNKDELYEYETPGEHTGDIDLMNQEHDLYKYRWKVITQTGVEFTFVGHSRRGLLYQFSISYETAEMPYGETIPQNITINNNKIFYSGTAENSQLEYPWVLRLTADSQQNGTFTVTVGNRTFEHTSQTPIQSGDVFLLKGVEFIRNGLNVNNYTNYEHFILEPRLNREIPFSTTFTGKVEILDFVEFYK